MDRSRTMPRLCFVLTAALTLLGAALRSVCMLTQFDAEVGYFAVAPLATLSDILCFAILPVAIVSAALIPKGALPDRLDTRLRLPAAFLWGAALAAFSVCGFILRSSFSTGNLLMLPIILGIPAALYFFVSADRSGRYSDGLALLGFFPVLWCVAAVGETYSDQFTAMNSPIKVGLQLGFLGLAFVLTSELRFRLGKPLPRAAVAMMGMGCFFALNGSLPVLLGTGAHILDNTLHLFYAIVLLCGGLYGLYTLFQYVWFPAEEEPDAEESDAVETPASAEDITETPNAE